MTANKYLIPYLVIIAISVTLMATDLYLPAMPMMVDYFNASDNLVQNSISTFQLGIVFSAIIYGPLSDTYGRRRVLLVGYSIFMLSSFLLVLSTHIDYMLWLRLLQGSGAGVAVALAPAIIRDCFSERESGKVFAQMSIVILLTPAIAPVFGGYLTTYFGWQACFIFIAMSVAIALAIFSKFLPETNPIETRTKLRVKTLIKNYKLVLSNKSFMGYVLCHSLPSSAIWCYLTVMPFIYIKYMGVGPEYFGYYVFVQVMANALGSYFVQKTVIKQGANRTIFKGVLMFLFGSLTMTMAATLAPSSPILATMGAIPFLMGISFVFPTSLAKAMSFAAETRGAAGSCIASTRQIFAFLGSLTAAAMPDTSLFPAIIFMATIGTMTGISLYFAKKWDLENSFRICN